jgi:hypothetical protein
MSAQSGFKPTLSNAEQAGKHEIPERREYEELKRAESCRIDVLDYAKKFPHSDHAQQRRALDHQRKLVAEWRDDYPCCLRQNDETQGQGRP